MLEACDQLQLPTAGKLKLTIDLVEFFSYLAVPQMEKKQGT